MSTRIGGVAEVTETGLRLPPYDDALNTTPGTGTDVDTWVFRLGGPTGEIVCTVTLTFSDNTKTDLVHVQRDPLF